MQYDLNRERVADAQVGDTLISYDRHRNGHYIGRVARITKATLVLDVELPNGEHSIRQEVVTRKTARTRGGERRWFYCDDPDGIREKNREEQRKAEAAKAQRKAAELARRAEARAANPKLEGTALNDALGVYTTTMRARTGAEAVVVYTVRDDEVLDDEFNYVPGKAIEPVAFIADGWDGQTAAHSYASFRNRTVEEALFDLLVAWIWDR